MKRAIFRSVLACLCVYATFSGFSSKSFANEKVRGFVISSESESKTIEKVNNRILDSANGSSSKISYVVNIDDKISFSLAGLLSLDKNGVVIPVKGGNIDENSKSILKNSEQVYVVGDSSSISDDVLNNLEIKFQRIGSTNSEDTNAYVNKFLGNRDLLVVDVKESSDVLGAIHYAHIYNMNLYLFDSTKNINEKLLSENENSIYFFDGVNSVKDDVKAKIYDLSKKDKKEIKSYSLDGKDLLKIFKDKYSSKLNENVVLSERGNLTDMLSSYILADKSGYGYLIIDSNSMNLEIEKMLAKSNVKSLSFVSTDELGKYVSFRAILSSLNNEEVTGFEVEKSKNEIILSDLSSDKKGGNSVSEEVTVKKDETIVDGKVVSKEQEKTPETVETVKSGELNYSKVLTMNATSYTDDPAENGGYSTTRMGTPLRYGVVAVDPSVIPLGTKLYVEGYGYAVAEDTGGAIKGNRIDVCYTDKAKAHAFGRRNVKVYILK
ncbi:3D domain protein [Parvimonas sp. KA00067]|uniref:3D domain-containing protein n=1 Tax=Parvimonas parva TaxID=2769485 RepID=A0ABS1C8T8_9FIRM|nr:MULTISPECIES: 3D domain-containing protein [Parvimonas]KXB66431.1 3D domain protein [Parvimonas sp. KA00067]MBK1468470.1 3D domain-containing protein [Parvimonas parva]